MTTRDDVDLIENEETDGNGRLPTPATNDVRLATSAIDVDTDVQLSCVPGDTPATPSNGHVTGSTPVYYSTAGGVQVLQEQVVRRSADGRRVIVSPQTGREYRERTLKERDLRFLKIFSAITIIMFPPTGIIAFVYALKTERDFRTGVLNGDLAVAQKRSKKCERLILLTLILCLLMYVFIFAIIEKQHLSQDAADTHRTFGNRMP